MSLNLKEGAIFIADAHYNSNRLELLKLLNKIKQNQIITTQIIFMGDIFDFLSNEIDYFKNKNKNIIELINLLSKNIEMIYLEGNHDFNLKELFPTILVISRNNQAVMAKLNNQKIILAHGDIFTPISYNIYTSIIRNSFFLKFLNFMDFSNIISSKIDNWLIGKNISHMFNNFESFAKKRISLYNNYKSDIIIEGHFHQGKSYEKYINLPSLCVSNEYMKIDKNKIILVSLNNPQVS